MGSVCACATTYCIHVCHRPWRLTRDTCCPITCCPITCCLPSSFSSCIAVPIATSPLPTLAFTPSQPFSHQPNSISTSHPRSHSRSHPPLSKKGPVCPPPAQWSRSGDRRAATTTRMRTMAPSPLGMQREVTDLFHHVPSMSAERQTSGRVYSRLSPVLPTPMAISTPTTLP